MAWDDEPPKPDELQSKQSGGAWDASPPTPEELGQKSFGQKALGLVGKVGQAIDSVTGAPMRAGISAAQNANTPGDIIPDAAKAAVHQFGRSEGAPTGEDIVKRAGVPEGTASKVAGFGMDMAANPLNFVGGAAKLGSKALAPAAEAIQSFANTKALKAAGAMAKDLKVLKDKGTADALGQYLLDNSFVKPLSTVSRVADHLSEAKATAGQQIGHLLEQSQAAGAPPISARDIALKLSEDPEIAALAKIPGKEATARQVDNFINTLYKSGDNLTLREAQHLRQGIDSSIDFNKRVPDMAGAQPYLTKMRNAINEKMSAAIDALTPGGERDALKKANDAYSKIATLENIANNRAAGLAANRSLSLTDTMAGVAGAASGHAPLGVAGAGAAAALGNKAVRTFGNPIMATAANKAAGLIAKPPSGLIPAAIGAGGQAVKRVSQ